MKITGIILAGGKSRRMGTDKALIQFRDKSLIENAIGLVQPLCSTILISSNNPAIEKFGFPVIPDEVTNCGPIGGLYSTLKKTASEWNFVISVDCPFVSPEFVEFLMSNIIEKDCLIPKHIAGIEPLVALYHKKSLSFMEKAMQNKEYKVQKLIAGLNTEFIDVEEWLVKKPELFRNLNRPEDLIL